MDPHMCKQKSKNLSLYLFNIYWSTKFISKIWSLLSFFPRSPPHKRLIRDYKKSDSATIKKALDWVNWEKLFDTKDINAQVSILSKAILNAFENYIPSKYITIDDKDPVWMDENIKSKIKTKNLLYKQYIQNGRLESGFVFL